MSNTNYFAMEDDYNEFEMWQGLRGPYFQPHVAEDGTLSWTNNGGLPNPDPITIEGHDGAPGFSPTVEIQQIQGGHRVIITDEYGPHSFDVIDYMEGRAIQSTVLNADYTLTIRYTDGTSYTTPSIRGATGATGPAGADGTDGADGADGVSPEVTITTITGGHRVKITDADHPQGQSFDVMDGTTQGGLPAGGGTMDFLRKSSDADYAAEWVSLYSGETPLMDSGNGDPGLSSLLSRRDHRHPTDTSRASAATLATYTRPNLLDNPYFVGGGSQLGYGIFPVNQRGQTSYPNSGYFIDRWSHTLLSATIVAQYVTIANTTASPHAFSQILSSTSAIKGKIVTLSFLTDTAVVSATISLPAATSTDWTDGQIHLYGDTATYFGSIRLSLVSGALSVSVIINANTSVNFLAAKLEIGDTQTLAHQENGTWVLNELPDYATELAQCQRFYKRISGQFQYIGQGVAFLTPDPHVRVLLPCEPMFKNPVVTLSGTLYLTNDAHIDGNSIACTSIAGVFGSSPYVKINAYASGLTASEPFEAQFRDTASYIEISAE